MKDPKMRGKNWFGVEGRAPPLEMEHWLQAPHRAGVDPLTICEVGLNGGHSAVLFLEAAGRGATHQCVYSPSGTSSSDATCSSSVAKKWMFLTKMFAFCMRAIAVHLSLPSSR